MKTILKFAVIMIFAVFLTACDKEDQDTASDLEAKTDTELTMKKGGIIGAQFPQAEQQVLATFNEIALSLIEGDIDKLISFHAYGPKFTEFRGGEPRFNSDENEAHERSVFGAITEVLAFEAIDLQVAVYGGNVANLTFHSNFELMFETGLVTVNDQITLLFVRTNKGWKIVHEHHSPLNAPPMM